LDASCLSRTESNIGTRGVTTTPVNIDTGSKSALSTTKRNRYTGSKGICDTRFGGGTELLSGTFSFDDAVNARYQSVHRVTINISILIWTSIESEKDAIPRTTANIGVQTKLIIKAEEVNLTLRKDSSNILTSTERSFREAWREGRGSQHLDVHGKETKKSIAMRNGSIKEGDQSPKSVWMPGETPAMADIVMKNGRTFSPYFTLCRLALRPK
jgi:hypothetical protein